MKTAAELDDTGCPATSSPGSAAFVTPGTRLSWSTLEGWLDAWNELQTRRARSPRYCAERAHFEALTDVVVRGCFDVETLDEVRTVAKKFQGDRSMSRRARGGELPSALIRMWTHNQASRLRAVPDLTLLLFNDELRRLRESIPDEAPGHGSDALREVAMRPAE